MENKLSLSHCEDATGERSALLSECRTLFSHRVYFLAVLLSRPVLQKTVSVPIPSSLVRQSVDRIYDTRCYFNVRSKADIISQLNLPHE